MGDDITVDTLRRMSDTIRGMPRNYNIIDEAEDTYHKYWENYWDTIRGGSITIGPNAIIKWPTTYLPEEPEYDEGIEL